MDITNPKEEQKKQEEISATEQKVHFGNEFERPAEEKEPSPYEQVVSEELKREIELMEIDPALRAEAEDKAKKMQFLESEQKLEHLLKIAKDKGGMNGIIYAVNVAKAMNDPNILDTLHDILAKGGYYKQFLK